MTAHSGPAARADLEAHLGTTAYSGAAAYPGMAAGPGASAPPGHSDPADPGANLPSGYADPGARPAVGHPGSRGPARLPTPAVGRTHVLQARRRMLTMLVALAVAVTSCVLLGLTRWWTDVPPLGMLGVYLMLLREAARADAEALRRGEANARARAARAARVAHERAREAPSPSQTAEVIDISGRTAPDADQPYDQYADAAVRAVGD